MLKKEINEVESTSCYAPEKERYKIYVKIDPIMLENPETKQKFMAFPGREERYKRYGFSEEDVKNYLTDELKKLDYKDFTFTEIRKDPTHKV